VMPLQHQLVYTGNIRISADMITRREAVSYLRVYHGGDRVRHIGEDTKRVWCLNWFKQFQVVQSDAKCHI
jgi:hypothetical protein